MRTEYRFVISSCYRQGRGLSSLAPPVVFLLTFPRRFLCCSSSLFPTSVVSYVAFVLSFYVSHNYFFWYLGKAVLRHCGMSCVSSHIFDVIQN